MSARLMLVGLPLALIGGCSLFLDTGDLAGGPTKGGPEGGPDGTVSMPLPEEAGALDAGADAIADARPPLVFPDAATLWPTNGHAYEVVLEKNVTFLVAKTKAEARGGHLATATSEDENDFIWLRVLKAGPDAINTSNLGPILGALQDDPSAGPNTDWKWITGETWSYTAWNEGEPNDAEGERAIAYYFGPRWADVDHADNVEAPGYVVEYE